MQSSGTRFNAVFLLILVEKSILVKVGMGTSSGIGEKKLVKKPS
jgi:hypothetical protein